MNKNPFRINAHSHLLPYPEDIPTFMKEKEIFWIDEERKFMHQKGWKRPITDSSFFLNEKLEWMQKNKIDHAVVLNLSQLYGNGLPIEDMVKAIGFQNDFNAKIQRENPSKFTCGFVVNPIKITEAKREIKRCVEELELSILCLPTHYLNANDKWQTVFHSDNDAIFELADEYNLAIEIHPYDGEKFIQLENTSWRFHLVWMLAQCADAYHFLTLNNYTQKYPNLRFCFAHGGQLAQANIGRRIFGFEGRPDLFEGKTNPKESIADPNIYFDTLTHDILTLDLLLKRQGSGQVILGLDDPYPLGEMDSEIQNSYPGKILDAALEQKLITQKAFDAIWKDNTINWLFGENETKKNTFLSRIGE